MNALIDKKQCLPPVYTTILSERDCSVQVFDDCLVIGDGCESITIEHKETLLKIRKAMDEAARKLEWIE